MHYWTPHEGSDAMLDPSLHLPLEEGVVEEGVEGVG